MFKCQMSNLTEDKIRSPTPIMSDEKPGNPRRKLGIKKISPKIAIKSANGMHAHKTVTKMSTYDALFDPVYVPP